MNPIVAFAILGAGAFVVWYSTRPGVGGLSGLFGGASTVPGSPEYVRPFLTDQQIEYYTSGYAHLSGTGGAATGASAGAPLGAVTFGISVGVGALIGWLTVRSSNDTQEDRDTFAKRLGFPGLGTHTDRTLSFADKSKGLYSYLTFIGRDDLRDIAMRVIGRKDFQANVQWMADVLVALWQTNSFAFPK